MIPAGRAVPPTRLPWLILPAALAALVYHAAPGVPYLWDDHILVEALRTGETAPWRPFLGEYVRPVTLLLLSMESGLGGGAPVASHVVGLALHVLACIGLGLWLRREGLGEVGATVATSLFAVAPLGSEAVLWTCARGDLLVATCGLWALAVTAAVFPLGGGQAGRGWSRLALALALVGIAVLSKESGVAVAAAVGLRAVWPVLVAHRAGGLRRAWPWMVGSAVLAVAYVVVRAAILPPKGAEELVVGATVWERSWLVLAAVQAELTACAWPFAPDLARGVRQVPAANAAAPWIGLVLLSGVVASIGLVRRAPRLSLAGALVLTFLAPVSQLVPIPIVTLTADRYLYLPLAAVALVAGAGVHGLIVRPRLRGVGLAATTLMVAGAVLGSVVTHARVTCWLDEERFLRTLVAEADDGNGQPAYVLGTFFARQQRCDDAGPLLAEAAATFAEQGRAVSEAGARGERGRCLALGGRLDEGITELRRAMELVPGEPSHAVSLIQALDSSGQTEQAIGEAAAATGRFPGDAVAPAELSRLLARQLRFAESVSALDEARRRAGATGASPLAEQLREAERRAVEADARIAAGEPAGYLALAALAEEYGNVDLAAQLRTSARPEEGERE
jgi:hypothetical protein